MICDWWHQLKSRFKLKHGAILITSGTVLLILTLRCLGGLQSFEWMILDSWFRLRPLESPDTRITIVTIDESDISKIQQWPFPDSVLAQAIANIKQQQPRVMGLDIYRDLPVEPGHQDLQKVLAATPNLIGIKKVVGNIAGLGVAPPPILAEKGRVAAADLVMDRDGKLRRNLLSLKDRDGQTILALGTKLALLYLEQEHIFPEVIASPPQKLRLGQGTFMPLRANDGGYLNLKLGGYQILGNFRRSAAGFATISFSQVLAGEIPPHLVRDRLILIGLKAESFQDRFYIPYSTSMGNTLAGVEVHADLASQIIATALGERKVFRFWSESAEWLWIIWWSGIGTVLAWLLSTPKSICLGIASASAGLIIGNYVLFLASYWVILVSPLLALVGAAVGNSGYMLWTDLQHSHRQLAHYAQTLEDKVVARTEDLQREISDRRLAQTQLKASLAEKELLLKEVYHRVKNNLQVISSLFSLQSQYIREPQVLSILAESQNRVQSMALVHQQLYQSEQLNCIDFARYLECLIDRLFACYQINRQRIGLDLQIDDVCLNLDTAILCGLITNELISNCLKYAFPASRTGAIMVQFGIRSPETLQLSIRDNGIGLPPGFNLQQTNTLGLRLVRALTRQLKGKLEINSDGGVQSKIVFPQSNMSSR